MKFYPFKKSSITLITMLFGICFNALAAEPLFIEVITSDSYPITGIDALLKQGIEIRHYNLDDGKRMVSEQLEANLPKGQKAAEAEMQRRIKKIGQPALSKMFNDAFQAVIIGTGYGLTRQPAVVFDHGKSVVYGVTDLSRALLLYRQWENLQ